MKFKNIIGLYRFLYDWRFQWQRRIPNKNYRKFRLACVFGVIMIPSYLYSGSILYRFNEKIKIFKKYFFHFLWFSRRFCSIHGRCFTGRFRMGFWAMTKTIKKQWKTRSKNWCEKGVSAHWRIKAPMALIDYLKVD